MKREPIHVKFENKQSPSTGIDLISLSDLFQRKDLDHSPLQLHLVEFYILIVIEEGEGVHTIDFSEYTYGPGTVFTIRKDQIHKFHFNAEVKGTLLLFTDNFLVSYLEHLEALRSLQLFNDVLDVPRIRLSRGEMQGTLELVEQIREEYLQTKDDYSLGIIRSTLHILITRLYRIKSGNSKLQRSRKYLEEFIEFQNLVEEKVSEHKKVKAYASIMGLSTKTLNTVTRTIVHKSAKEFIDEICTKQIKRLLINTEQSIKEIAYETGFEETTNFYKYFKRQTTFTPEQFRNIYK